MKDVQEIVLVRLDKDYDFENAMFASAYRKLENQVVDMAEELEVDIKLEVRYRTEQYGACTRRETYVVMILDTFAIGMIKLALGQNIMYSTGLKNVGGWNAMGQPVDGWEFKWRTRTPEDEDQLISA